MSLQRQRVASVRAAPIRRRASSQPVACDETISTRAPHLTPVEPRVEPTHRHSTRSFCRHAVFPGENRRRVSARPRVGAVGARLLSWQDNRILGRNTMRESSPTPVNTEGASLPANLSGIPYRIELATLKSESRSGSDLSSFETESDSSRSGSAHGANRRKSMKLSGS